MYEGGVYQTVRSEGAMAGILPPGPAQTVPSDKRHPHTFIKTLSLLLGS